MKRLTLCVLLLVSGRCAFAQSTTVSGTISDTSGQAWIRGTYSFVFKPSPTNPTGQYFWNGAPFSSSQTFQGDLDGSGHFSVSLPSNTSITPSGSTWVPTVCSIARGNSPCFTTQSGLTITGATQDLTSIVIPPAISIDLTHVAFPFVTAYKSQEITTATFAGLFWNFTLSHYFYCGAIAPTGNDQTYGACTNWIELCQVGDSCGGSSVAAIYQHNGTLVGQQPKLNFVDSSTTFTVTNDPGNSRVNISVSGGGGAGCTLPGTDTGVLSEHPIGTCFDGPHWTWDDGTGKQNMQAGLSNLAGFTDTYIFGGGNAATGLSAGFIAGEGNNIFHTDANVFVTGISNGLGQALNVNDCFIIGETNRFPGLGHPSTYGASVDDCGILGEDNALNFSNTGTTGGNPDDIWLIGSNNIITESGTQSAGAISSIHILGRQNTIDDILNSVDFVTIAGDRNAVDGAQTTAQILGWNNTLHNVSTGINTVAVGADNTLTNVATATYAMAVSNNSTLSNCDACYIFGENIANSTSHSIDIGLSNPPEIIITPGHVNLKAIPAAPTLCNLGGNISGIGAATPQVIITCATTAPASQCPCRAFVSWTIIGGGTSSTQQVEGIISDGTSNFAGTAGNIDNQITTGFKGIARSDYSPNLYNNSQSVTFTLTGESDHTWSAVTASFYLGAPTQIRVSYLSSN